LKNSLMQRFKFSKLFAADSQISILLIAILIGILGGLVVGLVMYYGVREAKGYGVPVKKAPRKNIQGQEKGG